MNGEHKRITGIGCNMCLNDPCTCNRPEDLVMTPEGVRIEVGQVWRDLDPRQDGRTVKVLSILSRDPQQAKVLVRTSKGVESRISVRRMRRNSTGYELVK